MDSYKYAILDAQNNLLKQERLLSKSTTTSMECSQCREFHQNHHVSGQMSLEAHLCRDSYEKEQSELLIIHQAETIEFQSNYIKKLEAILHASSSEKRIPGFPSSIQKEYDSRIQKDSLESSQINEDSSANLWKTPDWPITSWDHLPETWVEEPTSETMSEETSVSHSIDTLLPNPSRKGKERATSIRVSQLGQTLWKNVLEQEAVASTIHSETGSVSSPSSTSLQKETEFLIEGRPLLPDRHF
jgi:hypothetical protein